MTIRANLIADYARKDLAQTLACKAAHAASVKLTRSELRVGVLASCAAYRRWLCAGCPAEGPEVTAQDLVSAEQASTEEGQ